MAIALMALFGVLLAFLLVRYGPRARREAANPNEGTHQMRIGDGIRRLNAFKKKYAVMTPTLLAETPDDDLIEAVLSNLWAKMRPDMKDALTVIQGQSAARQNIFALYAVTGGVKQAGFEKIKDSPDAVLLPAALQALLAMDMPQSAALLEAAIAADEDADEYKVPYTDTFHGEGGQEKMIAYIRANPQGFSD